MARWLLRHVEGVALVGALILGLALVLLGDWLGGWFSSYFWVWAAPVVVGYWVTWKWWAGGQEDPEA